MLRIPVHSLHRCLHFLLQCIVIHSLCVISVLGGLCTKAVQVQTQSKKVHVLRRLPAACSNWDKSWAWLTKVDCGTKYRLDSVTVPPREAVTYRIEYVCCAGDTECEAARVGTTDEKFLAILLGSVAAALLIIGLIIIIGLCHRKRHLRCPMLCEGDSHIYETAEDIDEAAELQGTRGTCTDESNPKVCESEYEEIRDCKLGKGVDEVDGLPRYADIFGEKQKLAKELGVDSPFPGEAFNRATAPPLGREDPEAVPPCPPTANCNVHEVLSGTAKILATENESLQCAGDDSDKIYYNIDTEDDCVETDMQGEGEGHSEEGATTTTTMGDNCATTGTATTTDCKTSTDCSNYDKLIEPDTLSLDLDCHEYQKLVEVSEMAAANAEKCLTDANQAQVTMNGHLEAQSC